MKLIFAANAWLGPEVLIQRALFTFDNRVRSVQLLGKHMPPPDHAVCVDWLLPGFINAHCHLEYCWLKDQLPRGAVPFGEWIKAIMASRANEPENDARLHAMDQGAQALLRGGCTSVVDSSTDGASQPILERHGIRHFTYHEVLGLTQARAEPTLKRALGFVSSAEKTSFSIGNGLNPHAPYSVGNWLRAQLVNGQKPELPPLGGYAWHLAETPDEDELFLSGEGSIAAVLNQFGMPMPFDNVPEKTAFGYLASERLLELSDLVFHGNTLREEEAAFFKAPRGIVHCPSTHRWFKRDPAPIAKWIRAGVNVCLGTDSLASSDTLSMFEIIRMVMEDNPNLSADEILQMACINPAKLRLLKPVILGLHTALDGNEPYADFVALQSSVKSGDFFCVLKSPDTAVSQVWIQGNTRLQSRN